MQCFGGKGRCESNYPIPVLIILLTDYSCDIKVSVLLVKYLRV